MQIVLCTFQDDCVFLKSLLVTNDKNPHSDIPRIIGWLGWTQMEKGCGQNVTRMEVSAVETIIRNAATGLHPPLILVFNPSGSMKHDFQVPICPTGHLIKADGWWWGKGDCHFLSLPSRYHDFVEFVGPCELDGMRISEPASIPNYDGVFHSNYKKSAEGKQSGPLQSKSDRND